MKHSVLLNVFVKGHEDLAVILRQIFQKPVSCLNGIIVLLWIQMRFLTIGIGADSSNEYEYQWELV